MLLIASLPWLISAVGFLAMLERRGYPLWLGDIALLLTGFIGLAGFFGQTALRTWMVSRTLLAPAVLWVLAALLLPRRAGRTREFGESSLLPHVFFACVWGGWLVWNAFVIGSATFLRGSEESLYAGSVSSFRTWLQIYKEDTGTYPADLAEFGRREFPQHQIPEAPLITGADRIWHPPSRRVTYQTHMMPTDTGGWGYVNAARNEDGSPNKDFGKIFINCTHMNVRATKRLADY